MHNDPTILYTSPIAAAESGQRRVWVKPCVILGTLSDAEGGNYNQPESYTGNGHAAS